MKINTRNISSICSLIVAVVAVGVCIGWILNIPLLKSVIPGGVTMKFSTAITFFFSAIIIKSSSSFTRNRSIHAELLLTTSTLIVLLIMSSLLIGTLLNISTGIESLFVAGSEESIYTIAEGIPSLGTMVCFMIVGLTGLLALLNPRKIQALYSSCALLLCSVGAIALTGYAVNMPSLYYYAEGKSTAMALHTALLFICLGIGIYPFNKLQKPQL